ncbi:MAG: hypothetical protein KGN02_03885 [bacterium]|nr:hypothetical protein [bacterium]
MIATAPNVSFDTTEPRCYVLDESHRVLMICSPCAGDPLNARFVPQDRTELPTLLSKAVRALEDACSKRDAKTMSATIGNLHLRVNLLHGSWGSHTAVIVEPAHAHALA